MHVTLPAGRSMLSTLSVFVKYDVSKFCTAAEPTVVSQAGCFLSH